MVPNLRAELTGFSKTLIGFEEKVRFCYFKISFLADKTRIKTPICAEILRENFIHSPKISIKFAKISEKEYPNSIF
jgi:hypothetical protein